MNNQPLWYQLDDFSKDIEKNIIIKQEIKKNYEYHKKICFFIMLLLILLYIIVGEEDKNFMNSFKNFTL